MFSLVVFWDKYRVDNDATPCLFCRICVVVPHVVMAFLNQSNFGTIKAAY